MQIYGFLLNERRVYLVGERKQQVDTYSTRHSVELRRLTLGGRCARRFPVLRSDPFDIDDCSRLVAVVASELYSNNPVYQPLEGLLAVSAARLSHVDIYLQVSTHSFTLILDTVADSTEGIKEEEEEEEEEGEGVGEEKRKKEKSKKEEEEK